MPLCLATSDGTRRKTAKSKLFPIALSTMEVDNIILDQSDRRPQCYILDLAATIRSRLKPPYTFRELEVGEPISMLLGEVVVDEYLKMGTLLLKD